MSEWTFESIRGMSSFFLLFQEKIDRDHQKDTLSQRFRSGMQEVSSFNTSQSKTVEKAMATLSGILGLENLRDGGAWWAAVYGVAQSWTRLKRLSSSSSSRAKLRL